MIKQTMELHKPSTVAHKTLNYCRKKNCYIIKFKYEIV